MVFCNIGLVWKKEVYLIKLAIVGVITVIIATIFHDKREYGVYLGIAVCIIIGGYVFDKVTIIVQTVTRLDRYISINIFYIKLLLKMIGITYVAELSSQICTDAGYASIGKQIEIAGKFTILAISMPILVDLLDTVTKVLR